MRYEVTRSGNDNVLALRNDLSFADRAEFLDLLPQVAPAETAGGRVVVDLTALRFIDSAGMGLLLTLKDAVEKAGGSVVLRHPGGGVRQALRLASFDSLFDIEWEPEAE